MLLSQIKTFSKNQAAIAGFQALSEPLRLRIIELLLQQEFCVCDLCDQLEVSQSKLSFHLKVLREANLIRSRHQGRWIYYGLNREQLEELEQFLAEIRHSMPEILTTKLCE